ncbi:MAG: ABC transporter permease [Oscillospiraceae bacterium]|nr:ABC transporter permease [Oscillospiraceae bacterium]
MSVASLNDIIATSIRIATPVTLAALGGVFCQKAHIFNIGLEGMMLAGSFAVISGQILFPGSVAAGLIFAALAGLLLSALFALAVLKFDTNQIITGIGINLLSLGLTSFLLRAVYHTQGTLRADIMTKIPTVRIPFLQGVPILGGIFGEQNLLTYIAFVMVIITALLLYKTPFGVAACAIGELPECAATAGIKPKKIGLLAILWSGLLCGVAGTYLSTVSVSGFTEDMVQGRGFTAFSALIFGNGNPFVTWAVSILFGFADALGIRVELQSSGFPSSIIKMFPYILSVAALAASCYARETARKRKKTK